MKQLSKALAIALMVACAVAFMPLLNGQAFAAAKKPAKVKSLKAAQVADTMTAKATWKKGKNCKKYNVKVDGVLVAKKQKAKSYTTEALTEGAHKIAVAGVNGKKVGKYKTVTVNIVTPTPPAPTELKIESAVQTAANAITVTFNKEADPAPPITVTRAGADQKLASTVWSADKKSVVLTLNANLIEADYLITVTPALGTTLTATVAGQVAVITSAELVSENLILTDSDRQHATFAFKGLDQFGNAIDPQSASNKVTIPGLEVTAYDENEGVVTVGVSSSTALTIDQALPVAIVYANNTKVLNGTLKVSAQAYVAEISLVVCNI